MKIQFQNTEIHFTVSGKGPVIVWLHGFLESKEIWDKQLAFFNSKFTSVCIDLLGHGKTGCIGEVHSMELQAEAVQTVLNHLKVEKFSIVGHSMGGYVGLSLLDQLGSTITHFVLLNSTSYADTEEKKKNRERAIKVVANQKETFVRIGIVNLFSENNRKVFFKAIENLIAVAQEMSVLGITTALKGMKSRPSRIDILKDYEGKKLIVSGKKDPVISAQISKKESAVTDSELLELSGGHMSYLEATSRFNDGLLQFLEV